MARDEIANGDRICFRADYDIVRRCFADQPGGGRGHNGIRLKLVLSANESQSKGGESGEPNELHFHKIMVCNV